MKLATRAVKWIKGIPVWYVVAAAVVLLVLWFFLRPSSEEQSLLVLEARPFVQEVSVSGKVTPAQEVDLGFSQGGRIVAVYAKVGARVSQGATLAVTENGDLRAALLQKEAALENQKARLASIKAGTRPEEIAVAQSTVTSNTAALVDSLRDAYGTAEAAVHNTLDQFISNPRTAPQLNFSVSDSSLKASVEAKRAAAEAMLAVWAADVAQVTVASDLSAAMLRAQARLGETAILLSEANAALNRAIPTTGVPQSTLDTYSESVATVRGSVNAALSALTTAAAALDSSRKTLSLKQAGSTPQDIMAQEAQVKAAEADVVAAQAQLNKTVISAPFSGIITTVDAKVGKIVSPNTPEISLISSGAFQIESYVPEINVALISVGDKANITLDAYGDEAFEATVVSLDPAETVRDGVSTYRAILQFSTQDERIKSGMTANVSITTDTKESALAIPQGLVVYRDGKTFVRTVVGEDIVERQVVLGGVSSLGEVEIVSGLSAGETILATLP